MHIYINLLFDSLSMGVYPSIYRLPSTFSRKSLCRLHLFVPAKSIVNLTPLDSLQGCKQLDAEWAWLLGFVAVRELIALGPHSNGLDGHKRSSGSGSHNLGKCWKLLIRNLNRNYQQENSPHNSLL